MSAGHVVTATWKGEWVSLDKTGPFLTLSHEPIVLEQGTAERVHALAVTDPTLSNVRLLNSPTEQELLPMRNRLNTSYKSRVVIAAVAALMVSVAGVTAAHAVSTTNSTPSAEAQSSVIVRTGIIRLGTKVYLHTNPTHGSIGITSLTLVNGCRLRLTFDGKPGEKILAAIVEEDETVSKLDVQAGFSGNVTSANIYLYRNGREVCADDPMFRAVSNLWLQVTSQGPAA